MSIIKVGLISDTHGLLRTEAQKNLEGCELILHAGDLDHPGILKELEQIAPTVAVRGNMDFGVWARDLKTIERLRLGKWSLVIIHNLEDLPPLSTEDNLVIHGHSHRFSITGKNGVPYINPGSAGPKRFLLPITMGLLTLEDEKFSLKKLELKNKA